VGDRLAAARASLESSQQSLKGLEQLGIDFASVVERIGMAEGRLDSCRRERVEVDEKLTQIDAAERDLAEAAADCRFAKSEQSGLSRDQTTRVTLVDAERAASDDVERLETEHIAVAAILSEADAILAGVAEEIDRCERAHKAGVDDEEVAALALSRCEARVAVGLLGRRLEEFEQTEELRVAATRVLDANIAITTKARVALDQALTRATQAEAVRTAGQPTIIIEPTSNLAVEIDGVEEMIVGGESKRWSVDGTSTVSIPDIARVIVTAPNDDEVEEELTAAHTNLTRIVEKYGLDVNDPRSDLEVRLGEIAAAKQDLGHADSRRDAALFDLTPEQLRAKLQNALALVEGHDDADASLDVEAARAALSEATNARSLAAQELGTANAERRAVDGHAGAQRIDLSRLSGEREHAKKALEHTSESLTKARVAKSDDDLNAALESADETLARAVERQQELQTHRDAASPEAVRAEAANLEARERRVLNELDTDRTRREQLTGELRALGSKDLQADFDRYQSEVDSLTRDLGALERRARAAQLLRVTFNRHRETARANRARPYADEVNRLGRFVFGPSAHFTINSSDFTVSSRTMDGITVSFDQLSTGAKEQMSVVATLACAILVNPDGQDDGGGAPVILDDVLGFADPTRLRRLGPVFAEAAKSAQVILLTATPERYESIGEATFVRF
jgi:ABC-type phosphate transport system auxiliary subunit